MGQGVFDRSSIIMWVKGSLIDHRLLSEREVTSTELEVTGPTRLDDQVDSNCIYIGPRTKYVCPELAENISSTSSIGFKLIAVYGSKIKGIT